MVSRNVNIHLGKSMPEMRGWEIPQGGRKGKALKGEIAKGPF
jgi:hypothetical protein